MPEQIKAPKPFKKGTAISFSTGSRSGAKSYTGVVHLFVPAGVTPKVPKAMGETKPSNRDRYVVLVDDALRFANAKSCLTVARPNTGEPT